MPTIDQREEKLFLGALECKSREELDAFLDKRCAGDRQLRANVLSLLHHHEAVGRILDASPFRYAERDSMEQLGEKADDRVGRYRLLEQIGEGGMGVVYMAEQDAPVRRKVAIKIIKLGMDTKSVVARFESERQALALMDHPTITKVLDAGATETGRPYFVMELVQGTTLTQYCDKHRLSLQQRLELFVQVSNGIDHAHQRGIIHRDLKPSNIMIATHDRDPLPKIIDFGIAKAVGQRLTEKTLFTSHGDMIGTPAYMSPEQAEMGVADIDARSDIYSLGVLLYELLTGTTPFEMADMSYQVMQETIRYHEPECPSARVTSLASKPQDANRSHEISENRATDVPGLYRLLHGDLDWVILRCLSKDRTQRYQTARDLALDIRRFLNGDPVEAAAPSLTYRAGKVIAKHRLAFSTAIATLLVLVVGIVASSTLATQTYYADKRAKEAEHLAQLRSNEAEFARLELSRLKAELERGRAVAGEKQFAESRPQQRNSTTTSTMIAKSNSAVRNEAADTDTRAENSFLASSPAQVVVHPGVPAVPMINSVQLIPNTSVSLHSEHLLKN